MYLRTLSKEGRPGQATREQTHTKTIKFSAKSMYVMHERVTHFIYSSRLSSSGMRS